jgi:lipopolysaccharide transport system ATP-binding protein
MESPILTLDHVGISYTQKSGLLKKKKYWAVEDISFELYHGETLGVIGRNGAGKSTLLRLLAGIIAHDRGEVTRKNNIHASLLSLAVGFVPHLTGRQNAILSGMLLGMRRHQVEEKMADIEAFAELNQFFDQPVRTYSTGMRARLGFSVAIQADQDILLVDEVLGVGDEEFKIKSSSALKEKILSDKSVVIVSHNVKTLQELCNRVVWIENGRTRAQGHPDDVLQQYQQEIQQRQKQARPEAVKCAAQ